MASRKLSILIAVSAVWALMVIGLGASTRLTDAGLGCPDWPGCYGHLTVPATATQIAKADKRYATPVIAHKAWMEMIHRYFAGSLGVLLLIIIIAMSRMAIQQNRRKLFFAIGALFLLLVYQPILGMWTVTLKLLPIVVSQHLLGGISIFSLLILLYCAAQNYPKQYEQPRYWRALALVGIVLLLLQIALGAWTSTNYAAIVCPDFPMCSISPWHYDFKQAFNLLSPIGVNYSGGVLGDNARRTIQMMHRFGAFIVASYLLIISLWLGLQSQSKTIMRLSFSVIGLLIIQVTLGIGNAVLARPLGVAIMHNVTAALLMATVVSLTYFIYRTS